MKRWNPGWVLSFRMFLALLRQLELCMEVIVGREQLLIFLSLFMKSLHEMASPTHWNQVYFIWLKCLYVIVFYLGVYNLVTIWNSLDHKIGNCKTLGETVSLCELFRHIYMTLWGRASLLQEKNHQLPITVKLSCFFSLFVDTVAV